MDCLKKFDIICDLIQVFETRIPCHSFPKEDQLVANKNALVHLNRLMLYRMAISVYFKSHTRYINTQVHKSRRRITRTNKFCTVAPNFCGFSMWILLHIIFLASRILRWLLDFSKVAHPSVSTLFGQ
jgi:hypothetical protein